MTVDRAESLSLPYARMLAAGERHNAWFEDDVHFRGGWLLYRDQMYEQAGIGPDDIDFLQTYDDYPVISMIQMEDLGFCDKGAAAEFVRTQPLTWNGGGSASQYQRRATVCGSGRRRGWFPGNG